MIYANERVQGTLGHEESSYLSIISSDITMALG